MTVLGIDQIQKDEGHIFYRQKYSGVATIEIVSKNVSFPLTFIIDTNPLGIKTIEIGILPQDVSYPIIPLKKALKEYVNTLSEQGKLP
ncbi:MAG: hypothetical protein IIT68_04795 [Treponema sp.]|nr:hypothetical protein [Treponema sp.]